jgi:hypothetical protein
MMFKSRNITFFLFSLISTAALSMTSDPPPMPIAPDSSDSTSCPWPADAELTFVAMNKSNESLKCLNRIACKLKQRQAQVDFVLTGRFWYAFTYERAKSDVLEAIFELPELNGTIYSVQNEKNASSRRA